MVNNTQSVSLEHCYIVSLCCLYHGHEMLEKVYEMCDWARELFFSQSFNTRCNNAFEATSAEIIFSKLQSSF